MLDESTMRHLELIQAVISRMAQNSFAYKSWTVTLVAALFALAAKDGDARYLLVALLPTLVFWGLDAYCLRQERLFRKLYDAVRAAAPSELEGRAFSMETSPFARQVPNWGKVCCAPTIACLYAPLVAIVVGLSGLAHLWP